jgi:hypothetical protein
MTKLEKALLEFDEKNESMLRGYWWPTAGGENGG